MRITVLVDASLHDRVSAALRLVTAQLQEIRSPEDIWAEVWNRPPDLLILEAAGDYAPITALCTRLRPYFQFPVLVIGQQIDDQSCIQLLDSGADDVLRLAGGGGELPVRCRALARRVVRQVRRDPQALDICAGPLRLDIARRRLYVDKDQAVELTLNLTRMLAVLLSQQGGYVPAEALGRQVFGSRVSYVRQRIIQAINELHQRLAAFPHLLPLVIYARGYGYRITPRVAEG